MILLWMMLDELLAKRVLQHAHHHKARHQKRGVADAVVDLHMVFGTWPKISRYSTAVSTGAATVWKLTFQKRSTSL